MELGVLFSLFSSFSKGRRVRGWVVMCVLSIVRETKKENLDTLAVFSGGFFLLFGRIDLLLLLLLLLFSPLDIPFALVCLYVVFLSYLRFLGGGKARRRTVLEPKKTFV